MLTIDDGSVSCYAGPFTYGLGQYIATPTVVREGGGRGRERGREGEGVREGEGGREREGEGEREEGRERQVAKYERR